MSSSRKRQKERTPAPSPAPWWQWWVHRASMSILLPTWIKGRGGVDVGMAEALLRCEAIDVALQQVMATATEPQWHRRP